MCYAHLPHSHVSRASPPPPRPLQVLPFIYTHLVSASCTLYLVFNAFLKGLEFGPDESPVFALVLPMCNVFLTTLAVFGLLEVGDTILDPFGNDPEDFAIIHLVEWTAVASLEAITVADRGHSVAWRASHAAPAPTSPLTSSTPVSDEPPPAVAAAASGGAGAGLAAAEAAQRAEEIVSLRAEVEALRAAVAGARGGGPLGSVERAGENTSDLSRSAEGLAASEEGPSLNAGVTGSLQGSSRPPRQRPKRAGASKPQRVRQYQEQETLASSLEPGEHPGRGAGRGGGRGGGAMTPAASSEHPVQSPVHEPAEPAEPADPPHSPGSLRAPATIADHGLSDARHLAA